MGKLIDADILERSLTEIDEHINMDIFTNEVRELIDNAPTVEAIPKAEYEARLKADMVAMLEVIKLRIDNLPEPLNRDRVNYCIQEKINELKAESEGKE